jgi:hypothetical protein
MNDNNIRGFNCQSRYPATGLEIRALKFDTHRIEDETTRRLNHFPFYSNP